MKALSIYIFAVIVLISASLSSFAQNPAATGRASQDAPPAISQSTTMAASSALSILTPQVGAKIGSTSVTVRYQLADDGVAAASVPNYRIQLDSRDPVETTSTEYSFTGLKPGSHTLALDVVDANGTPIIGSHAETQFTTFNQMPAGSEQGTPGTRTEKPAPQGQQPPPPQSPEAALQPPSVHKANLALPPASGSDELPSAGGELPLLSLVGFGVLVGGVVAALRTRR